MSDDLDAREMPPEARERGLRFLDWCLRREYIVVPPEQGASDDT